MTQSNQAEGETLVDISKLVRISTYATLFTQKYRPGKPYTVSYIRKMYTEGKLNGIEIDGVTFLDKTQLEELQ